MIGVMVVVCSAFGLTISEAKTEIICLQTKGMSEETTISNVEGAGQMYNQTNEFVYLGEPQPQHHRCVHRGRPAHTQRVVQLLEVHHLELYDRRSAPLELKLRMLRAGVLETMLYGCVTWSPHACHYDTLATHPPHLSDSLHWSVREQRH